MKKSILSLLCLLAAASLWAQNRSGVGSPKTFHIVKEVKPANLNIVSGSVELIDPSGSNAIDANETCYIRFQVTNSGIGDGYGCVAKIAATGTTKDLIFKNIPLEAIKVGTTKTVEIPIEAGINTVTGQVEFAVQVEEPNGFGTDMQYIGVNTRAFDAPLLRVTDYTITGVNSSTLEKKQPFDLQVLLQNTLHGTAEDVKVSIELPEGVMLIGGEQSQNLATIAGGKTRSLVYSLIANNNYASSSIPINIKVSERHGKYAQSRTIELALNQRLAGSKIVLDEKRPQERGEIVLASLSSDVDRNIPQTKNVNDKTFAVIISNENYMKLSSVPYALNDGKTFSEYCRMTLGLPAMNIRYYGNATYGTMIGAMQDIQNIANSFNGDIKVLFYYAGHGAPNESTQAAYLLPVDAYGPQAEVSYSLSRLYGELSALKASSVTVFLDACFSGATRENTMLASARGVAIKPKVDMPVGKLIVFSATSNDETALSYAEKGHGLFTYYLLKKLQETSGDVTFGELGDYISTNVMRQSIIVNRKSQTPTVIPALSFTESWKTMKL